MPKEKKEKKPSQPLTYKKASGNAFTGRCSIHRTIMPFTVQKFAETRNGAISVIGVCKDGHTVTTFVSKKNWDAAIASGKVTVGAEGGCATCPYTEAPSTSGGAEGGADEDLGFLAATGAAHSRGSKKSRSRGSKKGSKKSRSHSRSHSRGKTGGAKKSRSHSRGKATAAKKSRSHSRGKAKKSRSRSRGKK